ncbi:MAG: hypothetical protein ACYC4L_11125 [Chloroflexota bacterium]
MWRGKRLLAAGIVAALLALAAVGAAFAQATPTPPAGAEQARTSYGQVFLDKLAAALGISRDELNAAAKTAAGQTVDQAQQDGKLTPERADRLRERIEQGNGFSPWWVPGNGLGRLERSVDALRARFIGGQAYLEGVAQALNTTVDDLKTQLRSGKSVADLAQAKGVSADAIKTAVLAAAGAELDQAVANGKLTAERAAGVKQNLESMPADHFLMLGGHGKLRLPKAGAPAGAEFLPRPGMPAPRGTSA